MNVNPSDIVKKIFEDSISVKQKTLRSNLTKILESVEAITQTLKNSGKVIVFGNGGSAADSQHFAAEFIGRFQKERKSFPAIALSTDTSALTALGNDYGFDVIFSRQLEGLGQKQDLALGISTSGKSKNVVAAIQQAKKMGMKTITLTGCGGGTLAPLSDIAIIADSTVTARIQESHILILHTICELVENQLTP